MTGGDGGERPRTLELLDRPAVLLWGLASALATALALAASFATILVLSGDSVLNLLPTIGALLVYDAVLVCAKPAVLPGLYAAVRAGPADAGLRRGLRDGLSAVGRHYGDVVRTSLRARAIAYGYAVPAAILLGTAVLLVHTPYQLLQYEFGAAGGSSQYGIWPAMNRILLGLAAVVLGARVLGQVPVGLAEGLSIAGRSPRRACRESAARLWRRPRATLRSSGTRALLGSVPFLVIYGTLWIFDVSQDNSLFVMAGIVLVVGTFTKAAEAVAVRQAFDGPDSIPSGSGREGSVWARLHPRRLGVPTLLAVLLVTALLAGSVGVRVTDYGSDPGPEVTPKIDDPSAAAPSELYDVATNRTVQTTRNVTWQVTERNWTTGDPNRTEIVSYAVDHAARERTLERSNLTGSSRELIARAYERDEVHFVRRPGGQPTTIWRPVTVYGLVTYVYEGHDGELPVQVWLPSVDDSWNSTHGDDRTRRLSVEDPTRVEAAFGRLDSETVTIQNESRATVWIDLDTQRVVRAELTKRFVRNETSPHGDTVERVSERRIGTFRYDDVTVDRPDDSRLRIESTLWDVLYY